jgi:DNA-binding GntR family transcriptional regulator
MPLEAPPGRLEAQGRALAEDVYTLLAHAIVSGQLAPGERVRDVEIAELYGISRTPVREAIQRLASQGLLEVSAHRYTRVTTPDAASRAEAIEYIGQLSGIAARLAVLRGTDAEVTEICDLLEGVGAAVERADPRELASLRVALFRKITHVSRNRMLIQTLRDIHLPVARLLIGWTPHPDDPFLRADSFRGLRDAFLARDADEAERIVREQHPLAEFDIG